MKKNIEITIFIPTFNCGKEIKLLIGLINKQKIEKNFEILIIDTSINEESRKILRSIKNIKLIEKDNKDFGHGKTRQEAIDISNGDYIVFITQDAVPYDDYWLKNIINPFSLSKDVACVFGRQIPYGDCNPLVKYWINSTFKAIASSDEILIHSKENKKRVGTYFNSNVNAAYRKSLFVGKFSFKDLMYAEDQDIAKQIIDSGYKKVYSPIAKVRHSHSWNSPYEYFQRFFDEYRGLNLSLKYIDRSVKRRNILYKPVRNWLADGKNIIIQRDVNIFLRIYWIVLAFPIEYYKSFAIYLGGRHKKIQKEIKNYLSREDMQRNLHKDRLNVFEKIRISFWVIKTVLFTERLI